MARKKKRKPQRKRPAKRAPVAEPPVIAPPVELTAPTPQPVPEPPADPLEATDQAAEHVQLEDAVFVVTCGGSVADLAETAQAKGWQLNAPAVQQLYLRAGSVLIDRCERDPIRLLARTMATNQKIIALAMEQGDLRAAMNANRQNAELAGLFPSRSISKGGKVNVENLEDMFLSQQQKRQIAEEYQETLRIGEEYKNWEPPGLLTLLAPPDTIIPSSDKKAEKAG